MATDWRAEARKAAARYGLDPYIFQRQIQQESGFNPNARSGAGALGIAQIMPGTAKGWGVDPLDPHAALNAAAKNMASYVKKYGGYENALRAYNAGPGAIERSKGFSETNHYVATILNTGRVPDGLGRPGGGGSSSGPRPQAPSSTGMAPIPGVPQIEDAGQAGDFTSLLASLIKPQQQAPTMAPIAPPQFSGQQALPQGFRPLTPEVQQQAPAQGGVSSTLGLLEGLRGSAPTLSLPEIAGATGGVSIAEKVQSERKLPRGLVPLGGSRNAGEGVFKIEGPSPDRLQKPLVSFAEKVAQIYGGTLTGKDGSTHSKYTVNGNVSDHYAGNATDVFFIDGKPAEGERLIRAGRAALIAAGMPRAKALKAPGGLYNVGGHQIIFGVSGKQYGGNHLDHLHISAH